MGQKQIFRCQNAGGRLFILRSDRVNSAEMAAIPWPGLYTTLTLDLTGLLDNIYFLVFFYIEVILSSMNRLTDAALADLQQ